MKRLLAAFLFLSVLMGLLGMTGPGGGESSSPPDPSSGPAAEDLNDGVTQTPSGEEGTPSPSASRPPEEEDLGGGEPSPPASPAPVQDGNVTQQDGLTPRQGGLPEENDIMPMDLEIGDFVVEGCDDGMHAVQSGRKLLIKDGAESGLRVKLKPEVSSTDQSIEVGTDADVEIILDGLHIEAADTPAINLVNAGNVVLNLNGINIMKGGEGFAAIAVGDDGDQVTVKLENDTTDGELSAVGGSGGAGIGGNRSGSAQNILVQSGVVTAAGGSGAAGIGGGAGGTARDIAVEGGTVTAAAGSDSVPAIGVPPAFGAFVHLTYGSAAGVTPTDTVVEWTGSPPADWSGLNWVSIQPMTVNSLKVEPATAQVEVDGTAPAEVIFTASLDVTAGGRNIQLPVTELADWSVTGGSRSTVDRGKLTVGRDEAAGELTVRASYTAGTVYTGSAVVAVTVPTPTAVPTDSGQPTPTAAPARAPDTGDSASPGLWAGVLCACGVGAAWLPAMRAKRTKR